MAYEHNNLSALAYANGFTLWHYKTVDAAPNYGSNYFGRAASMLRAGDVIYCQWAVGSREPYINQEVVASNDGEHVETRPL